MISNWFKSLDNPVFIKEMRVGFREKKVFYALMAWVILVAIVASLSALNAFDSSKGVDQLPDAGIFFMEFLFWIQLGLLAMLAPSLTTSAVSGERERKSFDMLLTTHLSPSDLILGKFGFAASFITLALCSTVPLESIVFFLGGVSLKSFVIAKVVLAAYGLLCALLGLMMSARETRSAYATGQTYLALLFLSWPVIIGTGGMRYSPDPPLVLQAMMAVSALYFGLFLYWKSVNHLEDRARHLIIILTIGLLFYAALLGFAVLAQYTVPDVDDAVWCISGPIHYFLFGMLLNPMRPARKVERERFAKNILSQPTFWLVVLSIGLLAPLTTCDNDSALSICLYSLVAGVSTSLFARGLALKKPSSYPQYLGACWILFNILPFFALVENLESSNHAMHPALISPMLTFGVYLDQSPNSVPKLAMMFYALLLIVAVWLHRRHRKRLK